MQALGGVSGEKDRGSSKFLNLLANVHYVDSLVSKCSCGKGAILNLFLV